MYELQILTWLCVLPDFNSHLPHWYAYAAKQMPLLESSAISGIFYPWPSPQFHHGHVWEDHFLCWTAPDDFFEILSDRSCTS